MKAHRDIPLSDGQSGTSTVELVIVIAFLLPILLGSMYLAKIIHAHVSLAQAAHAGARAGALQLRQPDPADPSPWGVDGDTGAITITDEPGVQAAMVAAARAAIDPDKYDLNSVEAEILCKCVKTTDAGVDTYSDFVTCDDAVITGCTRTSGFADAYKQIHARLQAELLLDFPFIPVENFILPSRSTMQAEQVH